MTGDHSGSGADGLEPALFTDLYELTMLRAYRAEGMRERAVFSLFVRAHPRRNFLVAAGLDDVLAYLESLRFGPAALDYLRTLPEFPADFVDSLATFRFTGDVWAVPEGTPVFANEPLLEVEAPIDEAQLVETYLLNQVSLQTMIASKGVRSVLAAGGKPVIDFGTRRTHGIDAALKAARALSIVGVRATSNVEGGRRYGLPVTGTMAHSYIQAHEDERAAFRAFVRAYPDTTLLVDTYDTEEGVRRVVQLARAVRAAGEDFRVRAVRLDSGDLGVLARSARAILDAGGLADVDIVVSGGLDEDKIAALEAGGAPIASYAVGTTINTSADAPTLDSVYKLVAYGGEGRVKLSESKETLPGRKQVFRRFDGGEAAGDVIACADETLDGEPLLRPVMRDGRVLPGARPPLDAIREHAAAAVARLPARLRALAPAEPPYPVALSDALQAENAAVRARLREMVRAADAR